MEEKLGFLRKFLQYELKSAERYRRFVSLVMVSSTSGNGTARKVIMDSLRNSDVLSEFNGAAVVLMSETTSAGALTAIGRYKNKGEKEDLRFSLVTYPSDGGGEDGLLSAANRRLQKALKGKAGSVVMTG